MANANEVTGYVRQFRERQNVGDRSTETVWSFRLERFDEEENSLRPITVEMTGTKFTGAIAEGDKVTVRLDKQNAGGIIRVNELFNETTGSSVNSAMVSMKSLIAFGVFVVLAIIIAFVAFHGQKATQQSNAQSQQNQQINQEINQGKQKVDAQVQADQQAQNAASRQMQKTPTLPPAPRPPTLKH